MKKGNITILIVLMSVALIGIIVAQVLWMNTAINLTQQQQNRAVNEGLHNVAFRIDNDRKWRRFQQQNLSSMMSNFFNPSQVNQGIPTKPSPKHLKRSGQFQFNYEQRTPQGVIRFLQNNDTTIAYKTTRQGTKELLSKDELAKLTTPLGGDNAYMQNSVDEMQHFFKNMLEESMYPSIHQQADPDKIFEYLKIEFLNRRIDTNFEFAIINSDSVYYSSNNKLNDKLIESTHKVRLFTRDIFNKDVVLSVIFPVQRTEVMRQYGVLLSASGLFTLFVIGVFLFSIYQLLRQKKLSKMKSDFINNMTHEFKTPLATISLAADSIENPKVIERADKIAYFTGMIRKENKRLNNQIERILQFARLEKQEIQLRKELIDVQSILSDCIENFKMRIEQEDGKMTTHFNAHSKEVELDVQHIGNVFNNLIDNAIKYSPNQVEINIETHSDQSGVYVTISDKGQGMSKKVLSNIFEQFYRAQQGNVHDVKGHGIGLSYVKAILTLHKGDVKVESKPGHGSTFTVFLPYKQTQTN